MKDISMNSKRTIADRFAMPTLLTGFGTFLIGVLLYLSLGNNQKGHWTIFIVGIGLVIYVVGRLLQVRRKQERQNS